MYGQSNPQRETVKAHYDLAYASYERQLIMGLIFSGLFLTIGRE